MASDVMARSRAADDGSMFNRPWLAFYDRRARPPPCAADVPAILRALDENSLCEIASRLGPRAFARLATTCAAFRDFVYAHDIDVWRGFCMDAFAHRESAAETAARKSRHGSYRAMFQQRLRLRTDGLYVSRNTYIKPGAKTMENAKCCHLVAYYRYFRFYRTGEFVCKTSPRRLRDEAKLLKDRAACARSNEVCHGGYTIDGEDRVRCEAIRPKSNGEWSATYFWVRLRQNKPGASNRLDVVKIAMVDGDNDPPHAHRRRMARRRRRRGALPSRSRHLRPKVRRHRGGSRRQPRSLHARLRPLGRGQRSRAQQDHRGDGLLLHRLSAASPFRFHFFLVH